MKAIMLYEYGGPEVLKLEEQPTPVAGPGEALIEVAAAGVNFVEIYQRMGWYKLPLPCGIGGEAAGTVVAVGPGVTGVAPGDRVAWLAGSGSYATHAVIPAEKLVPLPAALSFEQGAAAMVQGVTAHVLSHATYRLKPGDRCLVHAAAGGVGRLLCQMGRMRGAQVIGTVSTEAKAAVARDAGADEVILYTQQDFEAEVQRITGGQGVNVVYDSVGKDTFDKSLNCLAPLGYMVLYGQSSGFVPPFDIQRLAAGGSLFLTRPSVFHYTATRQALLRHTEEVLNWVAEGRLRLLIHRTYPLAQAAEAQVALAARQTMGKLLLIP
jgi:NADPH2:quinone reductase